MPAPKSIKSALRDHRDTESDEGRNEGGRMVPLKPTTDMLAAGASSTGLPISIVFEVWKSMMAAAPAEDQIGRAEDSTPGERQAGMNALLETIRRRR